MSVSLVANSKFQTRGSAFYQVSSIERKAVENSICAPSSSHIIQSSFYCGYLSIGTGIRKENNVMNWYHKVQNN